MARRRCGERALEQLHDVARRLWRDGLAINCVCEEGDARKEIPRIAEREDAELIIVGRTG